VELIFKWAKQSHPNSDAQSAACEWAEVIDAVEEAEYGRFGWAVDPEGTRFELWEPPPGQ
jgi:predicted enzyme related to lactoylglutathione lyase